MDTGRPASAYHCFAFIYVFIFKQMSCLMYSLNFGQSCVKLGVSLSDPCGAVPAQDVLASNVMALGENQSAVGNSACCSLLTFWQGHNLYIYPAFYDTWSL